MKRLFPRAVPEALIALLFFGAACSPTSNVKPGAPVLTTLSIVEPSGTRWDVTSDTKDCPTSYAEGQDCDPTAYALCELGKNVVCHCDSTDMCDPTKGSLVCTYAPGSVAVALFDRLLDTTPFDASTTVASLTLDPPNAMSSAATDYSSAGSTTGLVFPVFFGVMGPTITISGAPALPTDSTVTFALDPTTVRAKDGKTPFTGGGPLKNGTIAFKTGPFTASITVPTPPPPMDMGSDMGMAPACPDAGAMMPEMDGGVDAPAIDGGVDAPAIDGGAPDVGVSVDAGIPADAGVAADTGIPTDAGNAADAGTMTPPSMDVTADMKTGAVTITFSSPVDMTILDHIKFTEDGQAFSDVVVTMPDATMMQTFPTTTVAYAPKDIWAPGKTYVVTVDAMAADIFGAKLGMDVSQSFTMAK